MKSFEEIKNYNEYEELFNNDLVIAVRNVLKKIEDGEVYDLQDSKEHNALIDYFNKFKLHTLINQKDFNK